VGGIIGTYQRASLIEPARKVMAMWEGCYTQYAPHR
jgi:hypothetical protein